MARVTPDLDALSVRLSSAGDDDYGVRLKEARRLVKLAEELYERADELVKQAEDFLPADEVPITETDE